MKSAKLSDVAAKFEPRSFVADGPAGVCFTLGKRRALAARASDSTLAQPTRLLVTLSHRRLDRLRVSIFLLRGATLSCLPS